MLGAWWAGLAAVVPGSGSTAPDPCWTAPAGAGSRLHVPPPACTQGPRLTLEHWAAGFGAQTLYDGPRLHSAPQPMHACGPPGGAHKSYHSCMRAGRGCTCTNSHACLLTAWLPPSGSGHVRCCGSMPVGRTCRAQAHARLSCLILHTSLPRPPACSMTSHMSGGGPRLMGNCSY